MKADKDQVIEKPEDDEELEDEATSSEADVIEEDDEPTKGMEGYHKSNLLSIMMHHLGKLEKSDLINFFNQSMASIGQEASPIPDGASAHNQGTIKMHPSAALGMKEAVEEDLKTVFGDNKNLSEDFKQNMTTLFEAAVSGRLAIIEAEMQEAYEAALNEELQGLTEGMLEKIDSYLSYVTEEWMKSNEVAIQSSLTTEITESFMDQLKDLFKSHYIEVPEGRVDVVEALSQKVEVLEAQLNETMTENMRLSEGLKEAAKREVLDVVSEGMTEVQSQKFEQLAEGVEFTGDQDEYAKKLEVIREAHFSKNASKSKGLNGSSSLITEEIVYGSPEDDTGEQPKRLHNPEMKDTLAAVQRTVRRFS